MHHKIWWKNGNPNKIISTGKSSGEEDEHYFHSDLVPDDDEFYVIDQGPPQIVVRLPQPEIDIIISDRAAFDAAHREKIRLCNIFLRANFLTDLSNADIEDYVDTHIAATPDIKLLLSDLLRIISALLKINDYSK